MRRFHLLRIRDISGVSGTGLVAEGVEFSDGSAVLTWLVGEHKSTVIWPQGMHSITAIHGHAGQTRIVWVDTEHA